ncbi:MAG: fumarylacetoacetate hydrolase family protein [Prevotellaceae bacterium]|jgi:2-keto-4-pentenoate hydratase/2-oxohepta-3-ene-1,7-dioic acid hydratase in catechol pathway|nr:fumarylacetoacetate hydrolase family protein [Prevotellaceae bacterium]
MKIICTGMNYAKHIEEFSGEISKNPIFFLKPETALLRNNQPFYYPDFTKNLHYETELVLRICRVGRSIPEKFAARYISEIGLGIDLTARDLQDECRKKGLPWEIAKGFDYSAPVSPSFIPIGEFKDLNNINFRLELNGTTVQKGNSSYMIFSFNKIISYVSQFITLKIGDLIFTGTPDGVGQLETGCNLKGYIEDKLMLDFDIK